MKKTGLVIFMLGVFIANAHAQEENFSKNLGIGGQLTQHQQDFGLGLHLTSPYFANDKIALRLRGNLVWNQHLEDNETTWSPYSNVSFGLTSVSCETGNFIRLYGEGGIMLLFPSDNFSSESSVLGGYGLFGFEFFLNKQSNYFIEIGGVGTGATADKVAEKPIYSNGLLINVGFRYIFSSKRNRG